MNVGDNYNRPKVFDLFYNLFCNNESKRTGTIKIRNKQLTGILSLRPDLRSGKPYPEVTAAFLPSSLGTTHSFVLVYST